MSAVAMISERDSYGAQTFELPPERSLRIFENENGVADCPAPARLLVIRDTSAKPSETLRRHLSERHRVRFMDAAEMAIEHVRREAPDVIVFDVDHCERAVLETFKRIRHIDSRIPVIFVTRTTGAEAAIEAMKHGAYDYLFKPLDAKELCRVIDEALEIRRRTLERVASAPAATELELEGAIVGTSPAMCEVYKAIGRVANQSVPVLIAGESGTGKELVARAIYQHSARSESPFLALNCAALPENLLESELFGHEKGAFTGADRKRVGKFEQCHGGTLFLDEIGDMPLGMQAKILRLVQQQSFERLGGNETISTDVRLIAATHRDLKGWAAEGKFRADLYYRLGVVTINLPPLRERGNDLTMLVHYYLRRFNREFGREIHEVAPEAMERLKNYSWPGNIRELESVLKQSLLQASGQVLLPTFLPEPLGYTCGVTQAAPKSPLGVEAFTIEQRLGSDVRDLYADAHKQLDRLLLPRVLEYARGSQRQSALLLGIARQTLRQKTQELGLAIARPAEDEETTI